MCKTQPKTPEIRPFPTLDHEEELKMAIELEIESKQREQIGRKIGYVRVSDKDQTENLQIDALKLAGCEVIYGDHGVSGAAIKRKGLDDLLDALKAGDTLMVWKLDRLGRSTVQLLLLLESLMKRKIEFVSVTQGFDTSTAMGRAFYGFMAVFAELERGMISERTKAGMASAKARGIHVGRPRRIRVND